MEIVLLWLMGIALLILTSKLIKRKEVKITTLRVLAAISIVTVGGITEGFILGSLCIDFNISFKIFITVVSTIVMWSFFVSNLGIYDFLKNKSIVKKFNKNDLIFFVLLYLVSSLGWMYTFENSNYEIQTAKIVNEERTVDNKKNIISFCGIDLTEIKSKKYIGKADGIFFEEDDGISAEILSLDKVSYEYKDSNGKIQTKKTSAKDSIIIFIDPGKEPYVEKVSYTNYVKEVNEASGIEENVKTGESTKWIYYLPKAILQIDIS